MYYFNPLRAARGAVPQFTAVNWGAVSLYNNSNQYLLEVWWLSGSTQAAAQADIRYQQTRLTSHDQGTITALVTGEPPPPGTMDSQDLAVQPTPDFFLGTTIEPIIGQGSPFPFAVLRPGWSLVAVAEQAAQKVAVAMLWSWCLPDELTNPKIGDPAIDRRARP